MGVEGVVGSLPHSITASVEREGGCKGSRALVTDVLIIFRIYKAFTKKEQY